MPFCDESCNPRRKTTCLTGSEDDQHEGWDGDRLHGGVGHFKAHVE